MNITSHQAASSQEGRRPTGCIGCLGMLIAATVLLLLLGYIILFHSPAPLRWVAKQMEKSASTGSGDMRLQGIHGSIARGVHIDKVTVHGEEGDSIIEGLTFRYRGLWAAIRKRRFVIEEISTERSDILVGPDTFDRPDHADGDETPAEDEDEGERPTAAAGDKDRGGSFELRQLSIRNTLIRTADGEYQLEIPLVSLSGLKIRGDKFKLAELEVVSDAVVLELEDASPDEIDGHTIPFTRKISGKVLPKLHPLVKQDIDFSLELAAVDGHTKSRAIAFGGALTQSVLPDNRSLVQFRELTLSDYMYPEGHLLPERLTVAARQSDGVIRIDKGEFHIGKTRFDIPEQQLDADDPNAAILGEARVSDHHIKSRLSPNREHIWPPLLLTLESEPGLPPQQLLALTLHHQPYDALPLPEKARIDRLTTAED